MSEKTGIFRAFCTAIRDWYRSKDKAYLLFYLVIFLICATMLIIKYTLHPVLVIGASMEPTYHNNQLLATAKVDKYSDIERGDIIVFYSYKERKPLIKRVVGLAGDTIAIVDGEVLVNGEHEEGEFEKIRNSSGTSLTVSVPNDTIFVLGDNRNNSTDSRALGCIDYVNVIGVVRFRIF